ncbi:putative 2-oxopent-4-enoate hydratase [Mycobacterium xenopi 4042]|uniref:Putative 2-oxopent-4-enoate hydratase n=1 Tax=Mycobacterium xenopi 4042 TaxID=1299334 RepID=X7ZUY5_MYCXE|nr:putative 2-oxopent-4-enoate hydratase [Mycobacterium xenopi 4042]
MGVDEPDYGHLLDEMQVFEHIPVRAAKYLYPRVEVEVGFILAADLPGAQCSEDDVLGATAALVPAIELIDTRITDWNIALCDTIADNASSAGFVLGEARFRRPRSTSPGSRRCWRATVRWWPRAAVMPCWVIRSPRWPGWPQGGKFWCAAARR